MPRNPDRGNAHAGAKTDKDGDATQTRQGGGMKVPFLGRGSDPSPGIRDIPNVPGEYEREEQTRKEQPKANYGQLRHLDLTLRYCIWN